MSKKTSLPPEVKAELDRLDQIEGDKYDQFGRRLDNHGKPTRERVQTSRAAAYAVAGTCLALLYALSQVTHAGWSWSTSFYAAVVGIPLAIADAVHYELALLVGQESYEQRSPLGKITAVGGALAGLTGIASFIYYVEPIAFWAFIAACTFAIVAIFVQLEYLKEKLYRALK
jgi:hypothetical protein